MYSYVQREKCIKYVFFLVRAKLLKGQKHEVTFTISLERRIMISSSFSVLVKKLPRYIDQTCIYLVYKESTARALGILPNMLNVLGVLSYYAECTPLGQNKNN